MTSPVPRYRLSRGVAAPVQQSPTTCGSASLTVARMLVDPAFAAWMVTGIRPNDAASGSTDRDERPESARFAESEQLVMNRTNALFAAGHRWNVPWPHAFGTSPLGARCELEDGAAAAGARYRIEVVRFRRPEGLSSSYRALTSVVADGLPGLLYIGSTTLPRHVVLVLPGDGDAVLDVYDPASGSVSELSETAFAGRRLGLAGWHVPWLVLSPRSVRAEGRAPAARAALA